MSPPCAPSALVLPSIHEMFPELRIHRAHPPAIQNHFEPAPGRILRQKHGYSFSVLRSHPRSASLQHLASSYPYAPSMSSRADSSSGSSNGDADNDTDCGGAGDDDVGDRRHACRTCGKRFNRPSSLRIHSNTHTGATPFRCPHPVCGREFNVKSNMRRHFRTHVSPGASSPTVSASHRQAH